MWVSSLPLSRRIPSLWPRNRDHATGLPGPRLTIVALLPPNGNGRRARSVSYPPRVPEEPLDRLTLQDEMYLRVEARGAPMHVAGLVFLDASPLVDSRGAVRLDAIRARVNARLSPRLRQVLLRTGLGEGPQVWVDDPDFDISGHIRARPVPTPADEASLLKVVAELNEPPLARSRPLWELWMLSGLPEGRLAMLIRLHHVVADGIAALALLGSWFDFDADPVSEASHDRDPEPAPSRRELFDDNRQRIARHIAKGASSLLHPTRWLPEAAATARTAVGALSEGFAPRTSLNGPVGSRRRLLLARADLGRVKAVAHAHGAKVNDVVLAAIAGGARALLQHRGEATDVELRAMVPVSERSSEDRSSGGNLLAVIVVPLPVGERDAIRRLERIAQDTLERKKRPIRQWDQFPTAITAVMNHQRLVNLFTSNMSGPTVPWYFAGARVLEMFQIAPVQGNVALNVGVLSYDGSLGIDMVGDADVIQDLDSFADGLHATLEELGVV
jgi:diacylglycerol O-acyltransferase / wax synthase